MSLPDSAELLTALTSGAALLREGRIIHMNPALCDLTGQPEAVFLNQSIAMLLESTGESGCQLCRGSGEGLAPPHAALLHTATGEKILVKVKHSLLPDGEVLCLLDPFSEDTTLTRAHSDFVSTIGHEFRTPLTSIKGFADTMLKYGDQLPADQQRRFIHIIKEQADRMIRLTENLLTVSRLGGRAQEMSFRPVSLPRLIDRVVQSIQAKLDADDTRIFTVNPHPALPDVWADADRLEQILLNLTDNAVKYSEPGSEVRISATLDPDDETLIRIRIADQGIGIPAEYLPRLFTKFYRTENPLTRQVEGTGLGLYIVKSLATSMGGEISVESEPGRGTAFTLIFPAATPERQAKHRRRLSAEEASQPGDGHE